MARSPSPPADSAERVYNMLCAAQTNANATEEEIKSLTLRVANAEIEIQTTQATIRDLQQQYAELSMDVRAKKAVVKEQAHLCEGVAEIVRKSRRDVDVFVDNSLRSELPLHPTADAGRSQQPAPRTISPLKLNATVCALTNKIRDATERRRQVTAPPPSATVGIHRNNTECARSSSSCAGIKRSFIVRFEHDASRRSDATAGEAAWEKSGESAGSSSALGAGEGPHFLLAKRGRKTITFDEERLETCSSANVEGCAPVRSTTSSRHAAAVPYTVVVAQPRLPRRTMWRTEPQQLD